MVKINTSEKATIPAKHYVSMQQRGSEGLPLAFMTPWGEDAAAKKRMQSVDSWAGAKNKDKSITIDNVPMHGFKLPGDIRKPGRYGGGDKWRIEDPRGFELEITSSNLAELLSLGTFEKGEILDQCVWGRDKGNNILVSVESDVYKEAVAFTQITTSSASWKDVKLGYRIILQNGLKGIYLGRYHYLMNKHWYSSNNNGTPKNAIEASSKSMHVIYVPTTKNQYSESLKYELHFLASPKLSGIIVDTELTAIEAELKVNEYLMNKECYVDKTGYGNDPIILSMTPIKDWKLSLKVDPTFTLSSIKHGRNSYGLFRLNDNTLVNGASDYSSKINLRTVIESLLKDGIYTITGGVKTYPVYPVYSYSYSSQSRSTWEYDSISIPIVDFVKDVREKIDLNLTVETKLGNTFTAIIR